MRKDSQKRKALQERRFRAELFLLVRVRFILLFYLDDVIIQIADSFLQAIVHQTKSGVIYNHEIHRVNLTAVTGFLFTTLCTVCCFPFEVKVLFCP